MQHGFRERRGQLEGGTRDASLCGIVCITVIRTIISVVYHNPLIIPITITMVIIGVGPKRAGAISIEVWAGSQAPISAALSI